MSFCINYWLFRVLESISDDNDGDKPIPSAGEPSVKPYDKERLKADNDKGGRASRKRLSTNPIEPENPSSRKSFPCSECPSGFDKGGSLMEHYLFVHEGLFAI